MTNTSKEKVNGFYDAKVKVTHIDLFMYLQVAW